MMEYILAALLIMVVAFVYACIIKPKARMRAIAAGFKAQGYSVYEMPYQCMRAPVFDHYMGGGKNGDGMEWVKN